MLYTPLHHLLSSCAQLSCADILPIAHSDQSLRQKPTQILESQETQHNMVNITYSTSNSTLVRRDPEDEGTDTGVILAIIGCVVVVLLLCWGLHAWAKARNARSMAARVRRARRDRTFRANKPDDGRRQDRGVPDLEQGPYAPDGDLGMARMPQRAYTGAGRRQEGPGGLPPSYHTRSESFRAPGPRNGFDSARAREQSLADRLSQASRGLSQARRGLSQARRGPSQASRGPSHASHEPSQASRGPSHASRGPSHAAQSSHGSQRGGPQQQY